MHPAEFSIFLHRALEVRLARLLELTAVEGWCQDPGGLHRARVASRRTRAAMELIDPGIYPGFKRHRRRLKALTLALGSVRELDVRVMLLEGLKGKGLVPAHQAVLEHAQEVLDRSQRRLRRRLSKVIEDLCLPDCLGLLNVSSLPDPFTPGRLADSVWSSLEPFVALAMDPIQGLATQEDALALHAVRIRVKKLRYALEILAPALPGNSEMALGQLRHLQTILGEHHDLAGLEAFLWDLHSQLTARRRSVLATEMLDILGLVAEDRRTQFDRFREAAPGFVSADFLNMLRGPIPAAEDMP